MEVERFLRFGSQRGKSPECRLRRKLPRWFYLTFPCQLARREGGTKTRRKTENTEISLNDSDQDFKIVFEKAEKKNEEKR